MASEVTFVADDLGLTPEVNRAILEAHRNGALHGASLMMGQAGTEEAVALARENPSLKIGWHLHLCDSQPVTCERWPWHSNPVQAGFQIGLTRHGRKLMRGEVLAQWDLFQATGLHCDFVNSHHHLHSHPMVYRELIEVLPASFSGWMRLGQPQFLENHRKSLSDRALEILMRRHRQNGRFRSSRTLWGIDRAFRMDAREVAHAIRSLDEGLHEFIFHPRGNKGDKDLAALMELKLLRDEK